MKLRVIGGGSCFCVLVIFVGGGICSLEVKRRRLEWKLKLKRKLLMMNKTDILKDEANTSSYTCVTTSTFSLSFLTQMT